ncbi:BclA C-terminal domain-containing protein [Clostridium pasteurianum]|uniref:BclA C-terminal domain-containing protein n=1 Tax=Clostridium pasteurianum BC1 TaxID=86416 RepID=R4JZM4_CLOPA|nr:hypothetical protein [Clostridium pasteurianum]AGK96282.1 hypothetical protein Clopa_1295 [Clostridium pasteurianum BC1]
MRIRRAIRYLRRAPRPKANNLHKTGSNIVLNTEKTKKSYIYFDTISEKSTNTFSRKHNNSVEEITHNFNDIDNNIKFLNTAENKINFANDKDSTKNTITENKISSLINSSLNSSIFASNNSGKEEITIHIHDSVPFNHLVGKYGSNISQLNDTTFEINTPGIFKITFILYTTKSSPLGRADIVINNIPLDSPTTLITPGTPLIGNGIFNIQKNNTTIKIVVSGLDLSLCAWKNANIIIEQLN